MIAASSVFHSNKLPSRSQALAGNLRPKALVITAIVLSVLLWASAFPAISVSLTAYTPTEAAFLRYLVASIALAVYALFRRMPLPRGRDLPLISVCGFLGFTVYNVALNAGQVTIASGIASFIISSEIAVIAILARVFFKEQLGKLGWTGIALCLSGIAIIFLRGSENLQLSTGAALVFVATLSISLYSVLQKPLLERYTAIQFTAYAVWTGTACLFLMAPQAVLTVTQAPIYPTMAITYMGLFPGVVAYVAWSYVLSKVPAAKAGSYLALIPVAALLIAWLWLREVPEPLALIGGAIVFCGVMLINQKAQFAE